MARWYEPTEADKKAWQEFLDGLPKATGALAERFPPWELFRLKDTGHRVYAHSFNDNGTLAVVVSGQFNLVAFPRKVFGISPDDLEPCELPPEGEPLGVLLNASEQLRYINMRRAENGLPPLTAEAEREAGK